MHGRISRLLLRLTTMVAVLTLTAATASAASTPKLSPAGEEDRRAASHTAAVTAGRLGTTSYSHTSDPGDYIGNGEKRSYRSPKSKVTLSGTASGLTMRVDAGDTEWWTATLRAPHGEKLHPGEYRGAERAPFATGRSPGMEISGSGRGCNRLTGSFRIHQILTTKAGDIRSLEATFEQHCEGAAPALRGTLRYNAFPLTYRMVSDTDDYIGAGITRRYNGYDTLFQLTGSTEAVTLSVSGRGDGWTITLAPPPGQKLKAGGVYRGAKRFPFNDDAPGLSVSGNGRGCNELSGEFAIQELIADSNGHVKALVATYEQHCEGGPSALRGDLRIGAGKFPVASQ